MSHDVKKKVDNYVVHLKRAESVKQVSNRRDCSPAIRISELHIVLSGTQQPKKKRKKAIDHNKLN